MKREPGFYWVKWQGCWEVLEWIGLEWLIPGYALGNFFTDDIMEKIDENRIINPNK